MAIYRRAEYTAFDLWHYHFLVAADGLQGIAPDRFCEVFMDTWKRTGDSEVEPYDYSHGLRGVEYVCEPQRDAYGNEVDTPEDFSPALKRIVSQPPAVRRPRTILEFVGSF